MSADAFTVSLVRHPESVCEAVDGIEVSVGFAGPGALALRYAVTGRIDAIRLPAANEQPNAEELWKDTCFEMFARTAGDAMYDELNLSPSGKWVQFSFLSYREGRGVLRTLTPEIATEVTGDRFVLSAHGALPEKGPWRVGLSAVIEEQNGRKSYWALAHPEGKPDFHHDACFALELPAARTA